MGVFRDDDCGPDRSRGKLPAQQHPYPLSAVFDTARAESDNRTKKNWSTQVTDLPKMTAREYQELIDTLNRKTTQADEQSARARHARNAAIARNCGCDCGDCFTKNHCLIPPCQRIKNRRAGPELDAAGRYPNGRVRPKPEDLSKPGRAPLKVRTAEQVDAAGRYPSGRAKPVVHARRNDTTITLPAPDHDEAAKMVERLQAHGWTGAGVDGEFIQVKE